VENRKKINFCKHIDEQQARAIRNETREIGHPVAIKTHTRPDPEVVQMLENNEAFAHATFRDPREIALSMLDHGRRSRAEGGKSFTEYKTVQDTVEDIKHQTNSLLAWLSLPNVRPLYYDDIAFDMKEATKNKAKKSRHIDEMPGDISTQFETIFAPMYELLISKRSDYRNDGTPVLDPTIPLCDWSETTPLQTGRNP